MKESHAEMEITRRDEQFDINEGIQAEEICINMDDANVTQCQEDCQKTNDGMFSHPIDIRHSETSKPIQTTLFVPQIYSVSHAMTGIS
jgi:hypothetical protein